MKPHFLHSLKEFAEGKENLPVVVIAYSAAERDRADRCAQ
jgi:hypothetical protein